MNLADSPSSPSDSSRKSSKFSDSPSGKNKDIFQSRKNSFLRSLKAALQNISNDQLIAQMFEDPNSTLFIPNRVVEIIQETLEDDRESLIMSLLQQNNETNIDSIELHHFLKTSKNVLNTLLNELAQTKRFINYTFKKDFINNEIENARMQVNAFVTAALSGRYISNTNSESLQKQVNFISKKFFEIDLPTLRSKYENEIKEHIENETKQQKMIASLTRQNEKLIKDSNMLAEKLNKSEKVVELLKEKLNSLQDVQKQVSFAKNQIKTMQKEVDKKNKAIDFYVSEKSNEETVTYDLSRLQTSYSKLKKKYEELEAENIKLKEVLSKKSLNQRENDHINSINQANLQMLKLKNASIPQLENELQKSIRHVKSLEVTNIEIAKRLDKSLKENRDLYKTIDQLKEEISGASNDRTSKAELRSEIELLNEELAAAKKQITDLDSNVFELSQYNQKLKREIDSKTSSLDQSMLDFSSQKSKFQNTLAESETKVSFLNSKLKEYESSIHFNMKQLRQKELQINELLQSKHELEELADKLKTKLDARETEFKQASITCEQSSEAYLYAQAELKQKETIINKLIAADELSKQQKEQMTDKIEENNLTIQKLNGSIHELTSEKDKMQSKIDEKENTIDELNGKIKESDNKLIEKDNLMTKLNSSNQSLRKTIKKLEVSKNNNEKAISVLREKVAEGDKQIAKHEESIQFLKSENQKLLNDKKNLQKKISDDNVSFEARLHQIEKEKVLLTKKQTEAELKLNSSIEECKSLTDKYNKSLNDFDELTKEKVRNQKESAQMQANLNEQIEKLKQNNAMLLGKFDNLLQQANEVVKIKRIHDIPGVLKKLNEKYEKFLQDDNKARKILKIKSEFESVPDEIQKVKDDRIRLLKFESKIRQIIGNFDTDFILQTIQDCLQLKNVLSALFKQQTTPSEYYEIIQNSFLRLQEYEERESVLDSLFTNKSKTDSLQATIQQDNDDDSVSNSEINLQTEKSRTIDVDNSVSINKDLPTYITTMQKMYRDSHHIIKKLCRLFEIRNQEEIPTRVSILLTQIRELKSILNINSDAESTASSTSSPNKKEKINYEANVSKAVADLVDQLKEAQAELRTINKLFDPSNDLYSYTNANGESNEDLPVNKQIENMQNENKKLRYILNSASQVISQQQEQSIEFDQSESESSIDLSSSSKSPKKSNNNSPLKKSIKKSSFASPLRNSVYLSSPLSRQPIDADFILKCQQLMQKIELLENQQKEVERFLPNVPNNFSRVRGLDETDNNSTNLVLIGSLPDRVKQMANRYDTYYNQVNECQKIFKDANKSYISINGNLPGAVSMILTRIEEFERQERMIKTILNESSAFSFSGNIQETISELVQKNLDLTLTFQQLNGIVFASKDDVRDDLVITVDRIVKEKLEYQKMIDEYSEILSGQNISQKITLLLQNDSFLTKLKQLLECETNDDLFAKVKNSRVLIKKISALIPVPINNANNNSKSKSRSKSKNNSSSDIVNIDEQALLEKMSHFQELFDFRREILDRFNSEAQSLQPASLSNSSIGTTSDSDSDNSLIASTHRKKIKSLASQSKASVARNQFETDQELFTFTDELFNELHVLRKMQEELNSILPRSVEGSIPEKVNQIVKQCMLYQRQYSALKKMIPSEFHGSLSSKVEQLINVLKKYQSQQGELIKIVNEQSLSVNDTDTESVTDNESFHLNESDQLNIKNDDSLISDVTQMKRKIEEINRDMYIINQVVPEEFVAGSERERVVMLVDEFNKQKLIIQSISSSLDKNPSSLVHSKSNSIEKEVEKAVTTNEDLLNEKIEALKLLDSTQSNQELLPLLKKTIQEKKANQQIITQLKKALKCSDGEVVERTQQLNKDSLMLRNIYQEMSTGSQVKDSNVIKKLKELKENSRVLSVIESTIPEDLMPYNDTNSSSKKKKKEIDANSTRLNLLQAKIALLIESYKDKHDTINKLSLNGNLTDSVSQIMIEKEELVQALSAIHSILSKSSVKPSYLDDISSNDENENNQSTADLSIGSKQMIVSEVTNLVNSFQQANALIAQLNEKLNDFPGDINTKLNEVLRQNSVLQQMQSDLLSLLPENLSGSLIERVSQLCSEFAHLENQQVAISRNIPIEFSSTENGQSVCQKVDSLQQDYAMQRKAIQRIQKMLLQNQYLHRNCSTIESVADCVEEILNQNSRLIQLQKNVNNKFGIFGTNKYALDNENQNDESNLEFENDTSTQLMNSIDETFSTIDQLKAENLELKENMNELHEISNHSDLTEFVKKSLKEQKTKKKIIEFLIQNNKNNGNAQNNDIFALVQEAVFERNSLQQEQKEITSILSDFNENTKSKMSKLKASDDSPTSQIVTLLKTFTEQEQILNDISHQIPKDVKGENTLVRFSNLVKKYNEQKDVINKASIHLDTNNNNKFEVDQEEKENQNENDEEVQNSKALIEQIQLLTKSNQKLLKERETIIDSLPQSFSQFEYPDSVLNLSSELQKSESFLNSISNSFKEAEDAKPSSPKHSKKAPQIFEKDAKIGVNAFASLPSQVELALEERNSLLKMKSRLSSQLHNEDFFEEIDRLQNIDSQLKFVIDKIPKVFDGNGVEKRIQSFSNEYQRKSLLIDKLDDTLPGSGDLVRRVQEMQDESEEAKRIISQLDYIMSNDLFEGKTLLEKVSNMAKRYQSINNCVNSTRDKSIDISEEVMKLSIMNKKNKEKINNVAKVLTSNNFIEADNSENYILEDRIEEIIEELVALREQLQFIDSEASSSATMKKVIKQKNIISMPGNNDAASRKVGILVQTNNQLEQRINSISELLSSHFSDEGFSDDSSALNLSIEDQISLIIKENFSLKSQVSSIEDGLNRVKGNDIFEKMNLLQVELQKAKGRIQSLSSLIPEEFDNSSLEANIEDLVKSYQSSATYLSNIDRIIPDDESDIIMSNTPSSPNSALKSNKSFMRNKINQNIQSKVSKIVSRNQEMTSLWEQVYKAFPNQFKESKDMIERFNSFIQQHENYKAILEASEKMLNAYLRRENSDSLYDDSFKSVPENISNLVNENETLKSTLDEINITIPSNLGSNSGDQEHLADVKSLVRKYYDLKNKFSQIDQLLFISRQNENDDTEDINAKPIEDRISNLYKELNTAQRECLKIKKAILDNSKTPDSEDANPIDVLNSILENKKKMTDFASHLTNMIPEQFEIKGKTDGNMIISDDSNFLSIERTMSNFVAEFERQKKMIDDVQGAILASKHGKNDDDDDDDEIGIEKSMINHIQAIYDENSKAKEMIPSEFRNQNDLLQSLSKFVKTFNSIKSLFSTENNNGNKEDILNVIGNYTQNHQEMIDLIEEIKLSVSSSLEKEGMMKSSGQKFNFSSNIETEEITVNQSNLNETLQSLLSEKQENLELLYRLAKLIPSQFSNANIEKSLSDLSKSFTKLNGKEANKPSQTSNDSLSDQIEKLQSEKEHLYEILDAVQKEIPEEIKNENKLEIQEEEDEENDEAILLSIHPNVEKLTNRYQMLSKQMNQIKENLQNDDVSEIPAQISALVSEKEKLERIENMLRKSGSSEESGENEDIEEKIVRLLKNQNSKKNDFDYDDESAKHSIQMSDSPRHDNVENIFEEEEENKEEMANSMNYSYEEEKLNDQKKANNEIDQISGNDDYEIENNNQYDEDEDVKNKKEEDVKSHKSNEFEEDEKENQFELSKHDNRNYSENENEEESQLEVDNHNGSVTNEGNEYDIDENEYDQKDEE